VRIAIARTAELNEPDREAIIQLCTQVFASDGFEQMFLHIVEGRHFLAYMQETLGSHAVVTTSWLQPEGLPVLKTAWVDAVETLPAYQRRGYGSIVMRHLAEHISDYTIAGLKTASHGFYERLGWETWRGALAGRSEDGLVPTREQKGVMVLRLQHTPPLNFDGALTIECQPGRVW